MRHFVAEPYGSDNQGVLSGFTRAECMAKKEFISRIWHPYPSANQSIDDENLCQFMQCIGSLILLTVFPDNPQREHIQG